MKLGLGTVQIGQAYGVSNRHGQITRDEAASILARAAKGGMRVLDTAANYGAAEEVLAGLDTTPFRIVTKTTNLSHGLEAVVARAQLSKTRLPNADTLLVHAVGDLKGPGGDAFWATLQRLKSECLFVKIGISAYAADDPAALAARFRPDVMQLPFSLLDQRLLRDGTLARLNEMGVEVHARSLFLQGLLFMEEPPAKLAEAKAPLARVRTLLSEAGTSPLAAALGFILSRPEIDVALVGVTGVEELQGILAAAEQLLPDLDWASLALSGERVLTPSLW